MLIDPNNLNELQESILIALLKTNSESNGWGASPLISYNIPYQDKIITVNLSHTIIKRASKKGEPRYEVVDNMELGKGAYGIVYPVNITLRITQEPDYQERLCGRQKPFDKRRVVKCIFDPNQSDIQKTLDVVFQGEYTLAKETPHTLPKMPIIFNNKIYLVQRRQEGIELFDVFNRFHFTIAPSLTTNHCFQLSRLIVEAYVTQVLELNIVHRDLKPENMMIQYTLSTDRRDIKDFVAAKIIDYALAKKGEEKADKEDVGSPAYASPEAILAKQTTKMSDIYSLARILALIWGIEQSSYKRSPLAALDFAKKNDYSSLFKTRRDLSKDAAEVIRSTLEKMSAYDYEKRIPAETILENFIQAQEMQFNFIAAQKPKRRTIIQGMSKTPISSSASSSSSSSVAHLFFIKKPPTSGKEAADENQEPNVNTNKESLSSHKVK